MIWIVILNPSTVEAEEMKQKERLPERFLKANGKELRDKAGTGNVVTLRGTNAGGWQVMEAWMCPTNSPDQKTTVDVLTERFGDETAQALLKVYEGAWWQEQDFDLAKELNFNVLRLPISCYNLFDQEGMLRDDTIMALDWFVSECEERNIYVILDLHAAPGSQNGRDHSGDSSGSVLFTDENAQKLTISLWEQLAQHYLGNATIAGYDLLNEPEGNDSERAPWGGVQLPFYDRLYQAIRAIDPDHLIIMNSIWEPGDMPSPSEYGWENVMYEYHFYGWDGMNDIKVQKAFTDSKVVKNKQAGHEVPVLVGEFTLFEKRESWEYALRVYEKNGWSWTTWTYKTVNMGSWGIYNSTPASTPKVDIYNDSEEAIREKWSKATTADSFTVNQSLHQVLQKWAGRTAVDAAAETVREQAELEAKKEKTEKELQDVISSKADQRNAKMEERKIILLLVSVLLLLVAAGFVFLKRFLNIGRRSKK
jgi:aryl-phospho-beta-D-glucosidase BglC (GH1 family)